MDEEPSSEISPVEGQISPDELVLTRAEKAYLYKREGRSLGEIARICGYASAQSAGVAIKSLLKSEAAMFTADERAMMIQLEASRLDDIQRAMWQSAMYGDPKAAAVALKAITERIKLHQLNAMDVQNNQNTVLVISGQDAEYADRLRAIVDGDS